MPDSPALSDAYPYNRYILTDLCNTFTEIYSYLLIFVLYSIILLHFILLHQNTDFVAIGKVIQRLFYDFVIDLTLYFSRLVKSEL
jgi:hypothetical protein